LDNIRNRLLAGLKITNTDPLVALDVIVTNLTKILTKLESEQKETDRIAVNQAKFLKKLNTRQADLEKDFAQIRLDLKSAMILHDEEYKRPGVDDVSNKPERKTTSKKLKELQDHDPLS